MHVWAVLNCAHGLVCTEHRGWGSGNIKKQIFRLSYSPSSVLLSCPFSLLDPEASYLPAFAESKPDLEKQGHSSPWPIIVLCMCAHTCRKS